MRTTLLFTSIILLLSSCQKTSEKTEFQSSHLDNIPALSIVYTDSIFPDFEMDQDTIGPIHLISSRITNNRIPVDIDEVVAEEKDGQYRYFFLIEARDSVLIKSITIADSSFYTIKMGLYRLPHPGMLTYIMLQTDSAMDVNDQTIRLTYSGEKFAPQNLHIRLFSTEEKHQQYIMDQELSN